MLTITAHVPAYYHAQDRAADALHALYDLALDVEHALAPASALRDAASAKGEGEATPEEVALALASIAGRPYAKLGAFVVARLG